MKKLTQDRIESLSQKLGAAVPGLREELRAKLAVFSADDATMHIAVPGIELTALEAAIPEVVGNDEVSEERIMALAVGARPVARIRKNQATTEFLGPASSTWSGVIATAKQFVDPIIPAVGRVELNNSDLPWAGTGWLIAPGVIVTNRHVAVAFARLDSETSRLVFKPGLQGGFVSADIDFLEEEDRLDSAEHPITSILWIAPPEEADVAFLRVSQASGGPPLPTHIDLAETEIASEAVIAAIGYPARDPTIRDQKLVISIFGDDVYEKKRLSPGKVMAVQGTTLRHDCSTLGGNSGSVLVDLRSGKAVGLHRGGLVDDSANVAVTASHLRELLDKALREEARADSSVVPSASPANTASFGPGSFPEGSGLHRLTLNVPIEITIRVGTPVQVANIRVVDPVDLPNGDTSPPALQAAKLRFGSGPNVLRIREGYRFKNGWITDEPVIVIEVREKLAFGDLQIAGVPPLPREIMGVGVDIRTAPLAVQLEALGVDLVALERPGKPAGYKEPPGYDDSNSDMFLRREIGRMEAVFHVSPDAGFANLKAFLERVERSLTATMYEWEPNHISDAIEAAIKPPGRSLRMVTQKKGVGGRDGTKAAVADIRDRLGGNFQHVWASVQGANRLIPGFYHIKVATRDGEEFWLSSGNWKDSNQPKSPTKPSVLRTNNREWHAIIKHERLAKQFQKYIEYDFRQAERFPLEDGETPALADVEFFVPDDAPLLALERVPGVTYADTLRIDEELDIQPLLTPDVDGQGRRMFMKAATDMIERATSKIYVQNQAFNLTGDNNEEFERFFTILKGKQKTLDVRVIFRDGADYISGTPDQQKVLETLKKFGLDVSPGKMRLQSKCHTKGIIIDSQEVLIGSQNLTNGGSLFNRDASLLVRSPKVAAFYEKIFLFDWDNLAHNVADERRGGVRRAMFGESTPAGFRRVKLSELVADD